PGLTGEREAAAVPVEALEPRRRRLAEEAAASPGLSVCEHGSILVVGRVAGATRHRGAVRLHLHARPVELAGCGRLGLEAAEDVADEHALAQRAADVLRWQLERRRG